MLKDSTAVIGLGLGGMTVTYEFQEKNYLTYSVNGSEQDIKSIPNAKNSMRLEGYDGLAGNRELAYEALKRNTSYSGKLYYRCFDATDMKRRSKFAWALRKKEN